MLLGQRGRCCFCAACPNLVRYIFRISRADGGALSKITAPYNQCFNKSSENSVSTYQPQSNLSLQVYEDSLLRAAAQYGPLSQQTENTLKELDTMIDNFLTRMKKTRMDELVNFIIMSDHGMTYGSNPSIQQHSYPSFPFDKYRVHKVKI